MVALLGASCGRYFHDFSLILVDIWKAKWSQVGIKLEFNKERAWKRVFLTNLRFPEVKTTIGRVAHVEVRRKTNEALIKNQSKVNQKLKPKMDGLWHRFLVDFDGFWKASWHPKSHNNRS